jgi:uncharacterized membrane protein
MGTWAEGKQLDQPSPTASEDSIMAKTATFAAVHFTVAFSVGYALTGSVVIGGTMALVEPAINTVAFYFHELGWKKFEANKEVLQEALANSV